MSWIIGLFWKLIWCRLGHLMLYDNEDQLDVRHVISLARYEVDIYGGGERLPEGELWIKRNCM
jgi:hypothetical protein